MAARSRWASRRLRALEIAGKPIAVVLSGAALGGGFELALAGHYRIATGDAAKLGLGLPEVTIGLMPGAGATQRLPRLMGLERSVPYLVEGRPIDLETALQTGVVHKHIEDPETALEAATRWAIDHRDVAQSWDVKGYRFAGGPHTPAGYASSSSWRGHYDTRAKTSSRYERPSLPTSGLCGAPPTV